MVSTSRRRVALRALLERSEDTEIMRLGVLTVCVGLVVNTVTADKPQQSNVSPGPYSTIKFP